MYNINRFLFVKTFLFIIKLFSYYKKIAALLLDIDVLVFFSLILELKSVDVSKPFHKITSQEDSHKSIEE